jgi:hypothetical protein
MNLSVTQLIQSADTSDATPPGELDAPRLALWHARRGEWDKAHSIAQDDKSDNGAWVHAHLHRVEGDLPNARFWYGKGGRDESTVSTGEEWVLIATELSLGDG